MNKIFLIYHGKLSSKTGVTTVFKNLYIGFQKKKDWQLNFNTLDFEGEKLDFLFNKNLNEEKVKVNKVRKYIHHLLINLNRNSLISARFYKWIAFERNAVKVNNIRTNNLDDVDFLFFHELFTPYYFREKKKSIWKKTPKILVLHSNGELFKMFLETVPALKKSEKELNRLKYIAETVIDEVEAIVFLSKEASDRFVSLYPKYEKKVFVVPNGIVEPQSNNNDNPKLNPEKIVISTVGTVCHRKGHDLIVDAFSLLPDEMKRELEIHIVGDGVLINDLKKKCDLLKINRYIHFHGASDNVEKFLRNSNVFLLPSRDEGLPMAIIEAMSMKLPVISTNVGGIPSMITEGETGWLINPNITELKLAFEKLIVAKGALENMGMKAYERFLNDFSIDKMIQGYIKVFNFAKSKNEIIN